MQSFLLQCKILWYIYDTYDVEKQAFVTNVALLFAVNSLPSKQFMGH